MLVTPESAISKAFQQYLITIQANHQSEHIVIDEAHVALDGRGDFQPKLQRLPDVGRHVGTERGEMVVRASRSWWRVDSGDRRSTTRNVTESSDIKP